MVIVGGGGGGGGGGGTSFTVTANVCETLELPSLNVSVAWYVWLYDRSPGYAWLDETEPLTLPSSADGSDTEMEGSYEDVPSPQSTYAEYVSLVGSANVAYTLTDVPSSTVWSPIGSS